MTDILIRPAERADCDALGPRLRDSDKAETWASVGLTPVGSLVMSYYSSSLAWTVEIDGQVEAMMGVGDHPGDSTVGIPWLLGSPELGNHPREMLTVGRRYVALLAVLYLSLRNAVHHEHHQSCRWLEHLGFRRVATLEDFGVHKETFYLYSYDV